MKREALLAGAVVLVLLGAAACSKKAAESGSAGRADGGTPGSGAAVGQAAAAVRGWLEVQDADLAGHEVRRAGTGEKAGEITSANSRIELAAGSYDVVFGRSVWKDIEVTAGTVTRLVPGRLTLVGASLGGHEVVDAGTGLVQGSLSSLKDSMSLVPGRYLVKFGPLDWAAEVEAGRTTALKAGIVEVQGAHFQGHSISTASGLVAGEVSNIQSSIPLPPGDYVIEIDGKKYPFTLREGARKTFERK